MTERREVPASRTSSGEEKPTTVRLPDTDAELLAALGTALHDIDPVPQAVIDAARASLTWRTIDAELAELVEDSALDPFAGVRSTGGPRLLTFEFEETAVVLEVSSQGVTRKVLGQLVGPSGSTSVEFRHAAGSVHVDTDDLGRFSVDRVPSGPVSLVCDLSDGESRLVTSWVTV
jgi:hypothetical protein